MSANKGCVRDVGMGLGLQPKVEVPDFPGIHRGVSIGIPTCGWADVTRQEPGGNPGTVEAGGQGVLLSISDPRWLHVPPCPTCCPINPRDSWECVGIRFLFHPHELHHGEVLAAIAGGVFFPVFILCLHKKNFSP